LRKCRSRHELGIDEFEPDGSEPDGSLRYRALDGYHGVMFQRPDGSYDVYAKDGTRYHFVGSQSYVHPFASYRAIPLSFTEDSNGNRQRQRTPGSDNGHPATTTSDNGHPQIRIFLHGHPATTDTHKSATTDTHKSEFSYTDTQRQRTPTNQNFPTSHRVRISPHRDR
jgi:hypothetical protein